MSSAVIEAIDLVKAGFGSWAEVSAMSDDLRRMLWYGHMMREGMEINWDTGEVKAPSR